MGDTTELVGQDQGIRDDQMAEVLQHLQTIAGFERMLSPSDAVNTANFARTALGATPELAVAAAMSGVPYDDPRLRELILRDATQQGSNWMGLKTTVQNLALTAEAVWEEGLPRLSRTGIRAYQQAQRGEAVNLVDQWRQAGSSDLAMGFRDLARADQPFDARALAWPSMTGADYGSGFLPRSTPLESREGFNEALAGRLEGFQQGNGGLSPELTQNAIQGARDQMIDEGGYPLTELGHKTRESTIINRSMGNGEWSTPFSFGRAAALQVFRPDTMPFNIASGTVDAYTRAAWDPLNVPAREIAMWAKARNLIVPDAQAAHVGAVSSWRPYLNPTTFNDWVTSSRGNRIIRYLATNRSTREALGIVGDLPPRDIVRILDATDDVGVINVLRRHMGTPTMEYAPRLSRRQRHLGRVTILGNVMEADEVAGMRGVVSRVRRDSKMAAQGRRLLAESGDTMLEPYDSRASVQTWMDIMDTASVPLDDQDVILRKVLESEGDFWGYVDAWSDTKDLIARRLGEIGYEGYGDELTGEVKIIMDQFMDAQVQAKLYFDDIAGERVIEYGTIAATDEANDVIRYEPTAHLDSEFASQFIVTPTIREIRRATSHKRAIINKMILHFGSDTIKGIDPSLAAMVLDPASSAWRSLQLLRIGWPLRVLPEELIRQGGAGYSQMMQHPFSYLAMIFDRQPMMGINGNKLDDLMDSKKLGSGGSFNRNWENEVAGTVFDRGRVSWAPVGRESAQYAPGYASEIEQLWGSEIARKLATDGLDETRLWLQTPEGRQVLKDIASDAPANSVWRQSLADDGVLYSKLQSIDARINQQSGGGYVRRRWKGGQGRDWDGTWVDERRQVIETYQMNQATGKLYTRDELKGQLDSQGVTYRVNDSLPQLRRLAMDADGTPWLDDLADDIHYVQTRSGDARMRYLIGTGNEVGVKTTTGGTEDVITVGGKTYTRDEFAHRFETLGRRTSAAEKTEPTLVDDDTARAAGFESAEDAQQVWLDDWQEFSRRRGYTEEEISDYAEWMEMVGTSEQGNTTRQVFESHGPTTRAIADDQFAPVAKRLHPDMDTDELKAFEDWLMGYADDEMLPQTVKAPDPSRTGKVERVYDQATNAMFRMLMEVPTNRLVRSPFARIRYTEEIARYYLFADDATRVKLRAWARSTGMINEFDGFVAQGLLDHGMRKLPDIPPAQAFNFDEASMLAKNRAIEDTRELFYDLSKRGNWADMTRFIFPFADAWWEVLSRWAKMLDPTGLVPGRQVASVPQAWRNLRRVQMGMQAGRQSGFFSENEYGDEVFSFPGAGLLANWMIPGADDVGLGAEASLKQMLFIDPTMRSVFMPGTHPMIQIPAAFLQAPMSEKMPFMRDVMNWAVYGEFSPPRVDEEGVLARNALPSWARRLVEAAFSGNREEIYADEMLNLYSALLISEDPKYGDETYDQSAVTLRQAVTTGEQLAWLRIFDGVFFPAQPRYEPEVFVELLDSPDAGYWIPIAALTDEYRTAREVFGDNQAAQIYMADVFGFNPLNLVNETRPIRERPATKGAFDEMLANPELRDLMPSTMMAWVHQSEDDDFYFPAWLDQFISGERERVTPEIGAQMIQMAKGFVAFNALKETRDAAIVEGERQLGVGTGAMADYREAVRGWYNQEKASLIPQYWGWNDRGELADITNRPTRGDLLKEMLRIGTPGTDAHVFSRDKNPELSEWVAGVTTMWRQLEEASGSLNNPPSWWYSSDAESGEARMLRQAFTDEVKRLYDALEDEDARTGAEWYANSVIGPLLEGIDADDEVLFVPTEPPVPQQDSTIEPQGPRSDVTSGLGGLGG